MPMKDLLKNFKIQRVLNQLSDQTIDLLVARFCDESKPDLKILRKDKKKKAISQTLAELISDHPRCVRALRVAHFFHKERSAFIGLRPFLSSHNELRIDWEKIDAGKSEAEQVLLLYMDEERLSRNKRLWFSQRPKAKIVLPFGALKAKSGGENAP